MINKKPYSTPTLFRVELNHEQAILSACSLTATGIVNGGNMSCRPSTSGNCKNFTGGGGGDNGPRVS